MMRTDCILHPAMFAQPSEISNPHARPIPQYAPSDTPATPVNADVGVGSFPGSLLLFVVVEGRGLVTEGDGRDCDCH